MIVKPARRIAVPPGLVIEPGHVTVCPDSTAYDLAAHGAVLVGLRARVRNEGTVVGNAWCNAGDVVDLSVFTDLGHAGFSTQRDTANHLATSFEPTIGVIHAGQAEPVEVPVVNAMGMVQSGLARYAEPAKFSELA